MDINSTKQNQENQFLIFHSNNQQSLLSIKRANESLKFEMYGSPNQTFQKINMYELQIPNMGSISQLEGYFDTSTHFMEFIRNSSNIKINYEKGTIQILSKHPTKQEKNITITQIKLTPKQLLDNKNFSQITKTCLSSNDLTNKQIKCMLVGLSQQLMTLSQKPLRKKNKITNQNEGLQKKVQNQQRIKITKSLLQEQIDSVKQIMSKKLGKVMDEVEKNREILITQLQIIKNKLSQLQVNTQSNNNKIKEQFKSLIQIDKLQRQQKIQKSPRNIGGMIPPPPFPPMFPQYPQNPMNFGYKAPPYFQPGYQPLQPQFPFNVPNMMKDRRVDKKQQQKDLTKIEQIEPGQQYAKIKGKIIKCIQKKNNKLEVVIGDQTGIVNCYLNKSNEIKLNNTIILIGCKAQVYQQHIQIQLKRGGKIVTVPKKDQIDFVEVSRNISQKSWVQSND